MTIMKTAMQKAAKAKASTTQPPAVVVQVKPLATLNVGQWLKGALVPYLRDKYGKDRDAAQRGCDWLVETGRVKIPAGSVLVAVPVRAFGGALSFVVNPIGDEGSSKPKLDLTGMPD